SFATFAATRSDCPIERRSPPSSSAMILFPAILSIISATEAHTPRQNDFPVCEGMLSSLNRSITAIHDQDAHSNVDSQYEFPGTVHNKIDDSCSGSVRIFLIRDNSNQNSN